MQRITKKVHSKKRSSPLLSLLPWLLLATLVQAIINIFSSLHFSIIWNDLLFFFFYLLIFSIALYHSLPVNAFKNKQDIWKLFTWTLLGKGYIDVQIENGAILSDLPLKDQRKFLCADANSAFTVLQSDQKLTFHSAGYYCLEKKQTVLASFDLRVQSILVPADSTARTAGISPDKTRSLFQADPSFIIAATKDGYQVGAIFWIMAKYDCEFGGGGNPYGFDDAALEKSMGKNPSGSSILINPRELAVQELETILQSSWQNHVAQYDLLQIIPQEPDRASVLENIENQMRRELTRQDDANPIAQVLHEKGLRVLNLVLLQIWLSQETDIAVQHHWQPDTMQMITSLQQERQQKAHIYQELGEMQAVYTFLKQNGRIA